jgi:hypothetical protein
VLLAAGVALVTEPQKDLHRGEIVAVSNESSDVLLEGGRKRGSTYRPSSGIGVRGAAQNALGRVQANDRFVGHLPQ